MLKGFWEENKWFLVIVGCGAAVFLVANTLIRTFFDDAEDDRKTSQRLRQEVVLLHKGLKNGWYEEKRKVEACKASITIFGVPGEGGMSSSSTSGDVTQKPQSRPLSRNALQRVLP